MSPEQIAADPHTADRHDTIRVRGARVNNLKDVDVDIPKRRFTAVTGLSGSGKSSLVFGTLAAESRRLIDETYPSFVQQFMPANPRPDVDSLENLSAAVIVDQERIGANSRSTVGTATDAAAMLRIVWSHLSEPHVGGAQAFSFNVASASGSGILKVDKKNAKGEARKGEKATFEVIGGMCPECEGMGIVASLDEDLIVDRDLSLNDGAILVPGYPVDSWGWRNYAESGGLDPAKRVADYSAKEWDWLMFQDATKVKIGDINMTYEGLIVRIRRTWFGDREPKQAHIKAYRDKISTTAPCPECHGTRLNKAARTATVDGKTLPEATSMQVDELAQWVKGLDEPGLKPTLTKLGSMLDAMTEIGLGYLSLDRTSATLSGGEAQRIKMVRHLGSSLTDISYVFDEPTVGLHPHDIEQMVGLLRSLRDAGNTVLVVEHKPAVITAADHIIDIGPGSGTAGGEVVYAGPFEGLADAGTVTAEHLAHRPELRDELREPTGALEIRGASTNNLKGVDVDVPTGVLVAVTGVAGSGKSSLIHGSLGKRDDVLVIDQSPIKGSRRSNPATYTGLLDPIRTLFAKANDVKPALFSPNSEGGCPECNGAGVIYPEVALQNAAPTPCEVCGGRRFREDVLVHTYEGLSIADVFGLSVAQAAEIFTTGKAKTLLARMLDVGLGYVRLGQPLPTLSGGERQRLKLAAQMKDSEIFVLDEPSAGLHMADTANLVAVLQRLVEGGSTVIAIEHNLDVVSQADHVIDVGPGAGHEGGQVVFTGTPAELTQADTATGRALKAATA
ncbi:ATP-binding cassette domain-containing protein [Kytococcus sp. Marseille-QA3725]